MSDWFVPPETLRLDLVEGQWLQVKRRLNAGETRGVFRRLYLQSDDGTLRLNPDTVGTTLVTAYLVDWSLTDATGAKVEIAQQPAAVLEAALDALDPDKFALIKHAVEAHDERERLAREAEKKTPTGAPISPATSPSRAAAAGATSGSASSMTTST